MLLTVNLYLAFSVLVPWGANDDMHTCAAEISLKQNICSAISVLVSSRAYDDSLTYATEM